MVGCGHMVLAHKDDREIFRNFVSCFLNTAIIKNKSNKYLNPITPLPFTTFILIPAFEVPDTHCTCVVSMLQNVVLLYVSPQLHVQWHCVGILKFQ